MVDKKRLGVGVLVLSLAAAWAPGCSSSDDKAANNAGGAGIGEAGAGQAGAAAGHAGASASAGQSEGGSADGGEPSASDAGSAGALGEGGEAGASSEPDPRAPFAEWDRQLATVKCAREVTCGRWYSVASCVANALGTSAYVAYYGGADFYGNQVAHYTLASSAVQQTCLTEAAARTCDAGPNLPLSCAKVLVPSAPAAKGASCHNDNLYLPPLPCAAGLECARGPQCATCVDEVLPADLNGPCNYQDDCKPGLVCRAAGNNTYTCQKTVPLGQPCITIDECAQGVCLTTCQAYVGDGKACSDSALCQLGLRCGADNLCHPDPTPEPGASCKRHLGSSSDTCNSSTWCVFATPDAATGTCGAPVGPGPTPCSRPPGGQGLGCPFGTFIDAVPATNADGTSDNCTCQPRRPLGAACTTFQQCSNGQCIGSKCTARLPAGASCTGAAGECAGYCDSETTHQCVGPVVCAP